MSRLLAQAIANFFQVNEFFMHGLTIAIIDTKGSAKGYALCIRF